MAFCLISKIMTFHIITIFPNIFDSYFSESIIKRAQDNNLIEIKIYNLRDWTTDKHKTVDDTPFGGGAGMLMKIEPLYRAIQDIKSRTNNSPRIVLLSAKGKKWNQQTAQEYLNKYTDIILICGRYEGVDERLLNFIDEEISIGDYVLTGGEIGAMVLVDSIARLTPGALGNNKSSIEESHSTPNILEHPQYTRPEIFIDDSGKCFPIPKILISGNHQEIEKWKINNLKKIA